MDVKELKRLMDAMRAADVAELELEWDGTEERPGGRVALRRAAAGSAAAAGPVAAATGASTDPVPAASVAAANATGEAIGPVLAATNHVDVLAPIVGTYYATPTPDAAPFVRVGDRVKVGQVLCIIEAMKLMNEIEAEVAGTVVELLVRNDDPVEYGQPLLRLAPA